MPTDIGYEALSYILIFVSIAIVLIAQIFVSASFSKYKKRANKKGISGSEVAREILEKNGLSNVYVTETSGRLSDHYDPTRKVVRLSKDIYRGTTIAAASVAAHEVGHAIQDKEGYAFMRFRSAIFPIVNISSMGGYIAILVGIFFNMLELLWIGIALEFVILLFQLITLPVEFNASNRAKEELKKGNYLDNKELSGSNTMLRAAAFTYVAAVLTTLLQILRLVLIAQSRSRD